MARPALRSSQVCSPRSRARTVCAARQHGSTADRAIASQRRQGMPAIIAASPYYRARNVWPGQARPSRFQKPALLRDSAHPVSGNCTPKVHLICTPTQATLAGLVPATAAAQSRFSTDFQRPFGAMSPRLSRSRLPRSRYRAGNIRRRPIIRPVPPRVQAAPIGRRGPLRAIILDRARPGLIMQRLCARISAGRA